MFLTGSGRDPWSWDRQDSLHLFQSAQGHIKKQMQNKFRRKSGARHRSNSCGRPRRLVKSPSPASSNSPAIATKYTYLQNKYLLSPGARHRSNSCGRPGSPVNSPSPASSDSLAIATKNTILQNKPPHKSGGRRSRRYRVLADDGFQRAWEGTFAATRNQGRQLVKYGCGFAVSIPRSVNLSGFQLTPQFPSSSRRKDISGRLGGSNQVRPSAISIRRDPSESQGLLGLRANAFVTVQTEETVRGSPGWNRNSAKPEFDRTVRATWTQVVSSQ